MYGVEPKEERGALIAPITCVKCKEVNPPSHRFCKRCGIPLDERELRKLDGLEDLLIEFFKVLAEVFPQAKEKFIEVAKKKGVLDLFLDR
jgi:uncharacterized paraquat-inducible protein A